MIHLLERCPHSPTTKHVPVIKPDSDEIDCKWCGKILDPILSKTTNPSKKAEEE